MNAQQILDATIASLPKDERPTLLLHACCAPCSSYVLEYLAKHFRITLFFYTPNISPAEEYRARLDELCRLTREMGLSDDVSVLEGNYDPDRFEALVKGLEALPEGGSRCYLCYSLRLSEASRVAAEGGFDYVCTTLSISPHKNAAWLNEIGCEEAARHGVTYLVSDFKKKNGYKRSCELSAQYGLYRQDFCGCIYSRQARERQKTDTQTT